AGDDRASRLDVLVDPDATAPDGKEPTETMDEPLSPARRERGWCASEEPRPRLHRDGMHHDERVHPAPMGGPDEQIAARREVLLARGPDPEPEHDEQDEPGNQPEETVEDRRLRFRWPTEPRQAFDGPASSSRQGLR